DSASFGWSAGASACVSVDLGKRFLVCAAQDEHAIEGDVIDQRICDAVHGERMNADDAARQIISPPRNPSL
ncbi:MAG TPA: hypothetical protein VGA56_01370, partial [Opitutaceae bacterium]